MVWLFEAGTRIMPLKRWGFMIAVISLILKQRRYFFLVHLVNHVALVVHLP